jgi:hypothetical protein
VPPLLVELGPDNSEGNLPMVAVNEALGFRPAGHLSTWSSAL